MSLYLGFIPHFRSAASCGAHVYLRVASAPEDVVMSHSQLINRIFGSGRS